MAREEEKKSSATAKTALGLAIGGLSLAAVQGGILGGNGTGGCNGGGLLGGLFGNNGACAAYNQQKMDQGAEAVTELNMVNKYVMPMMGEITALQTKLAVNDERDRKNEVINGLLFQLSDARTDAKFQESQCCCEKNQIYMNQLYDKLDAADKYNYTILDNARQCTYDRLAADTVCNFQRLDGKIDANFALRQAQVDAGFAAADAKLERAMCGVIKGTPYLSPSQMADPYAGAVNMISTRTVTPLVATYGGCANNWNTCANTFNQGCGCNSWAW